MCRQKLVLNQSAQLFATRFTFDDASGSELFLRLFVCRLRRLRSRKLAPPLDVTALMFSDLIHLTHLT